MMKRKKIIQTESLFNTGAYEPEVSKEQVINTSIHNYNVSSKKMVAKSKVLNDSTFATEYECSNQVLNNTNGMEDEWRQELQSHTNVPKESKNLDNKSDVLNATRFLEELEYQSTPVNFLEEKTDVRG